MQFTSASVHSILCEHVRIGAQCFCCSGCRALNTAACTRIWSTTQMCICVFRSAGEMKGVSMEENRRRVAALKGILDRAENRVCADCQASGGSVRPSWASINTGVFICMPCAGIHRGLGVHISKVRFAVLFIWIPFAVAALCEHMHSYSF